MKLTAANLGKLPISFGTPEEFLFGFHHPPLGVLQRQCGVVLCNPIGDDLVRAHRPFRHLAERLARAGFPVLRFDFHGTGDSSGDERGSARVCRWLHDIEIATATLRTRSDVTHVCLLGLRMGATLAAVAAERARADSLVLWGTYESGTAFVREASKTHRLLAILPGIAVAPHTAGGTEALGFFLSGSTIADLENIDLFRLTSSPVRKVLVIGMGHKRSDDRLLEHFRALGSEVTYHHLPGQQFLMTNPHDSVVPINVLDSVQTWLEDGYPCLLPHRAPSFASEGVMTRSLPEDPIIFGAQHPLFGILHRPTGPKTQSELPAIIVLNAGCVHRIGPHRCFVPMARTWATLGFYVFRVDLSGIGDSPAADECEENLAYPRDALRDIEQAMTFLQVHKGINKFIVTGLCSGADLTFKIALTDRRVVGAFIINPRTFLVHDLARVNTYRDARWYQKSIFRTDSWLKLLRGKVNVLQVVNGVAPRVADTIRRSATQIFMMARRKEATTGTRHVPAALRMMAERGVDIFLVASEHDPGVDYLDANYGKQMRALHAVSGFRREDLTGTDHTLTALSAQRYVCHMLTEHLRRRHMAGHS